MNASIKHVSRRGAALVAAAVATAMLAACATAPVAPAGAAQVRAKLTQLQSNPQLATLAPAATLEAARAVKLAELPQQDQELARHNVYVADRKVDTAVAMAETAAAEAQRAAISQQRDSARLAARTQEADIATSKLATARVELAEQQRVAAADHDQSMKALADADVARVAAANEASQQAAQQAAMASEQAAELQRQIDVLHARSTERGLVLTLGDVLFNSGQSDLKAGTTPNLDRLVSFLARYPGRSVAIEGYTDSLGSNEFNIGLSQRRADSVKTYLSGHGIAGTRITSIGKGEEEPVASNDSAAGRQQNRRVEVIISNQLASLQ